MQVPGAEGKTTSPRFLLKHHFIYQRTRQINPKVELSHVDCKCPNPWCGKTTHIVLTDQPLTEGEPYAVPLPLSCQVLFCPITKGGWEQVARTIHTAYRSSPFSLTRSSLGKAQAGPGHLHQDASSPLPITIFLHVPHKEKHPVCVFTSGKR